MFFPLVAAFIVDRMMNKNNLVEAWGLKFKLNRWLFAPLAIILILVALTIAINLAFPGARFEPDHKTAIESLTPPTQIDESGQSGDPASAMANLPSALFYLLQVVSSIIAGYTINALFAFGEEAGWRGHLMKAFEGRPFWQASVFSGAVWGIWHAPLVLLGHNYPSHPRIGVAMMTLWCVLLTPFFMYIRIKCRSVFGAAFLHGFLNALAGMPHLLVMGGDDLTKGVPGAPGMIALAIMIAGLYFYDVYVSKDKILVSNIDLSIAIPVVD